MVDAEDESNMTNGMEVACWDDMRMVEIEQAVSGQGGVDPRCGNFALLRCSILIDNAGPRSDWLRAELFERRKRCQACWLWQITTFGFCFPKKDSILSCGSTAVVITEDQQSAISRRDFFGVFSGFQKRALISGRWFSTSPCPPVFKSGIVEIAALRSSLIALGVLVHAC